MTGATQQVLVHATNDPAILLARDTFDTDTKHMEETPTQRLTAVPFFCGR